MPLAESEAKVLLALLKEKSLPIMSLPKKAHLGGSAVYNSIRWLTEKKLIKEQREENPPRRRMIELTKRGKKVALRLEMIENDLQERSAIT